MRYKDVVIGAKYTVVARDTLRSYNTLRDVDYGAGFYSSFTNETVTCVRKSRQVTYHRVETGPYKGKIVVIYVHSGIKPADLRQHKIANVKAKLQEHIKKRDSLEKDLQKINKEVNELEQSLAVLERFKSDEEEIEHLTTEVLKTGGDPNKILKVLTNTVKEVK